MVFFCFGVAILALYILFAPRVAAWLYRPILFPRLAMSKAEHDEEPIIAGIKAKAINFFQTDGNWLCGWFFVNPSSEFTILISHGNLGNMATHGYLTEALVKAGYSVFIYDYSGYGASTGLPNLSIVTNDAEAAYDYLIESEGLKSENIVIYGESIGVSVSAHLASVRRARALICQSGFASFRRIATEKMPILKLYPNWLFPSHRLDTIKSFANLKLPILILHGEKDDIVPFHHAELLFKAASEPKKLVSFSNCDHKNVVFFDPDIFIQTLQTFLATLSSQLSVKK